MSEYRKPFSKHDYDDARDWIKDADGRLVVRVESKFSDGLLAYLNAPAPVVKDHPYVSAWSGPGSEPYCYLCGGPEHLPLYQKPVVKDHQHTDACWEPDSGCDMGRNEKFVGVVPAAPSPTASREGELLREAVANMLRCDGPNSAVEDAQPYCHACGALDPEDNGHLRGCWVGRAGAALSTPPPAEAVEAALAAKMLDAMAAGHDIMYSHDWVQSRQHFQSLLRLAAQALRSQRGNVYADRAVRFDPRKDYDYGLDKALRAVCDELDRLRAKHEAAGRG